MNSRLKVVYQNDVQKTINELYRDLDRRLITAPQGNCPVDLTSAFLKLCLAQSCGKCVPCRVGLDQLYMTCERILDGTAKIEDLKTVRETAAVILDTADCAIGQEAAKLVLHGMDMFFDDYVSHVKHGKCTTSFQPVPCVSLCPAHVDIPGYISLVQQQRYADAVRLIRKDNPFPSVCALICEHPCEAHCRRSIIDDAINIRGLKRFAVDHAGHVDPPAAAEGSGKRVAVVGGGPSGLTAAYYLSLMGHKVTIYEKRNRLGGMLRYGIPLYRLPDSYLDEDIETILSTGIDVKLNVDIGKNCTVSDLEGAYDSVYISVGAHAFKRMGIAGEDAKGVISAVELLRKLGDNESVDFTGKQVVVIGGGNVAMDATRTAKRLGAKNVTCIYRRRLQDMTALPEEIEGAEAEGCEVRTLLAPVSIEADEKGQIKAITVQRQYVGPYKKGKPSVTAADVPAEIIPCDILIVAIGQEIELTDSGKVGLNVVGNQLLAKENTEVLGKDGVFAGGDCVFGPATVIRAIEAGKVAAANIDQYLGFHHTIDVDVKLPEVSYKMQPPTGRSNMVERTAEIRKDDFEIMEQGLTFEEAMQECSKCLRCDHYGCGALKGGRSGAW